MPELDYKLSTSVNQDTLFNVKLDTQERMRDLYEGFNVPDYQPPQPFIPKALDTDAIIKGDVRLPTLDEALDSKDPAVVNAALQKIRQKAQANPMSRGVGLDNLVKYQEGQDKFTDKKFGFNPYKTVAENEDFYHHEVWDNYSFGGKAWRGVGTFVGRTLSKLVTGLVGIVGDLGSMAWNGLQEVGDLMDINDGTKNNFWNDVSNNWLARQMEDADNHVKEQWLPTYKALDYDNKGAWAKLLDPYTWQTSFADGAGFLLQFAVPGMAFGRLAQAGKLAKGIGKFSSLEELATVAPITAGKIAKAGMTIEEAKNVSAFTRMMGIEISDGTKLGKFAGNAAEFLTGSKDVGGMSAYVFNTSMEAVAETKEGFNHTVEELMAKGMSRDKAIEIASQNAPTQFWINTAILTASNGFQNKLIQKAIGNRSAKGYKKLGDDLLIKAPVPTTKVGKFFTNNKWGNRIGYYGGISSKAVLFEGFWEENAQTAAGRYAKGEYDRQGDDGGSVEKVTGSFLEQLYKQTVDAAKGNDREAADSIMAGAVIGILGGTTFAKISGERKQSAKDKAELVANYQNTRDAWLSLRTLDPDIYDKDGKIIPEKAKEKADQIAEKLSKISSVFKRFITAESLTDQNQREQLQRKVFGDFVKAHILNGTEEQLISKLNNWGQKTEGELALFGVSPEMKENAHQWAELAQELVDEWAKIKDIKYSAPKDETVRSYFAKTEAIKSLIFDYVSLKNMSTNLADTYRELKSEYNSFSKFPEQQSYNEKQAELIVLRQILNRVDTPIEKEQIKVKIEELEKKQKEQKELLSSLNNTKEDSNGFVFPKDIKPKDFNEDDVKSIDEYLQFQWHQSDHENAINIYDRLIKDYSNPETGLENYNKVVDYWSKQSEDKAEAEQDIKDTEEFADTLNSLEKQKEELTEKSKEAKTKEEKETIEEEIKETETKIDELKETFDKDEEDIVEQDLEEINADIFNTPIEEQRGTDSDTSELLAYVTTFKTAPKETRNQKDKDGNYIAWKEDVLTGGYDHKLTEFITKQFSVNEGKYNAFVIKDTEELFEERYPGLRKKLEDEGEVVKLGAIVVLKEKGSNSFVTFKNGPIIAFSYNIVAFEDKKDTRAEIKANREKITKKEALEFYAKQQKIADTIREMVLAGDNLQVPVKATLGSLGLFPFTYADNAFERFNGFHNNTVHIIKDENEFPGHNLLGGLLLEIPKEKTDSKLPFYIPVFTGKLGKNDTVIGEAIKQSIQAVQYGKFDTKEEAALIVKSSLKKLFYINEYQYFKVVKESGKYKIQYFRKDRETGLEEQEKTFSELKLKLLDQLYSGKESLPIYNKDQQTGKFIPTLIAPKDYLSFIHGSLETKRKLLVIGKKVEKVYTSKVNAYLNLQAVNEEDVLKNVAEQTTEQTLDEIFNTPPASQTDKKADIERRRQEELEKIATNIFPNTKIKDILYHGTNDKFDQFDISKSQSKNYGDGNEIPTLFFTDKEDVAKKYASEGVPEFKDSTFILPVVLNITNPLVVNYDGKYKNQTTFSSDLKNAKENNDSFVAENIYDNGIGNVYGVFDSNQIHILTEKEQEDFKNINAKYDAELAALDATDEQKVEALSTIKEGLQEVQKGAETIIANIDEAIRRKQEALDNAIIGREEGMATALTEGLRKIFEKKGQEAIDRLTKELEDLKKLATTEDKAQTPLEELRTEVLFDTPPPPATEAKVNFTIKKKEYQINFDTNSIISASTITPTDVQALNNFFEKAHSYTFKQLNINGNDVYLVKYNKLGKFAIFNSSYKGISETKELLKNEEYKKFKNCE